MKTIGNIIVNFVLVVGMVFVLWFVASFIDVNLHNTAFSSTEKTPWNMFVLMVENMKD